MAYGIKLYKWVKRAESLQQFVDRINNSLLLQEYLPTSIQLVEGSEPPVFSVSVSDVHLGSDKIKLVLYNLDLEGAIDDNPKSYLSSHSTFIVNKTAMCIALTTESNSSNDDNRGTARSGSSTGASVETSKSKKKK